MKKKFGIKKDYLIYIGLFLGLCLLCYLFPYSHDDWAWGSTYGMERLQMHFENYNGRWAGNLCVMLLTRSNLLKTIVMSGCLTAIIYFINKLVHPKYTVVKFLTILGILLTPYLVFRQAIVWTSGFTNYVIPMTIILGFLYVNRTVLQEEKKERSLLWTPLFLVLGFVVSLFVEHVTLYNLVLGISLIVYTICKFKKVDWNQIAYFIGSVLGTILMFSNTAYSKVAAGEDAYRSFALTDFIGNSITSFFQTIYKELIYNNYGLNLILSILIILILVQYKKKDHPSKVKNFFANICLMLAVAFPMYALLTSFQNVTIFLKYTPYINGMFAITYFLMLLYFTFGFIKEKETRSKISVSLISILVLTAPLFVVTPIGSRCFFPTYVFFILIASLFLDYYLKENEDKEIRGVLTTIISMAIIVFSLYWLAIYGYIYKIDERRIQTIKDHQEEEKIILPKLPYTKYTWYADPVNQEFTNRFKSFYHIDQKTELEFVSLKEWNKKR